MGRLYSHPKRWRGKPAVKRWVGTNQGGARGTGTDQFLLLALHWVGGGVSARIRRMMIKVGL